MASKFEILAALIEERADRFGDDMGWHHVINGVLRDLHDVETGVMPADSLADTIYERLADSVSVEAFNPEPQDRVLAPGEIDAETGRYNPSPE